MCVRVRGSAWPVSNLSRYALLSVMGAVLTGPVLQDMTETFQSDVLFLLLFVIWMFTSPDSFLLNGIEPKERRGPASLAQPPPDVSQNLRFILLSKPDQSAGSIDAGLSQNDYHAWLCVLI